MCFLPLIKLADMALEQFNFPSAYKLLQLMLLPTTQRILHFDEITTLSIQNDQLIKIIVTTSDHLY